MPNGLKSVVVSNLKDVSVTVETNGSMTVVFTTRLSMRGQGPRDSQLIPYTCPSSTVGALVDAHQQVRRYHRPQRLFQEEDRDLGPCQGFERQVSGRVDDMIRG